MKEERRKKTGFDETQVFLSPNIYMERRRTRERERESLPFALGGSWV